VVQLNQYGDFIQISDVVEDTHEDPILSEATQILSESAAQTFEAISLQRHQGRYQRVLRERRARTDVNTSITLSLQRRSRPPQPAEREVHHVDRLLDSEFPYGTGGSRVLSCLIHPDLETDVRSMAGFIPTKQYGTVTPWENEIARFERVRYLTSTVFVPFATARCKGAMRSTGGTLADCVSDAVIARDAYGIVPLRGRTR